MQRSINNYYKYPRTPHFPWSPGYVKEDDVVISESDLEKWEGVDVVLTEKLDGENTTMYSDYIHARSLDSKHHPSRSWVKKLHSEIAHKIPNGWRICGENLYAKHSIFYTNLPSYFIVFSIWNEKNRCISWNETKDWCGMLGLEHVPELWCGRFNARFLKIFWNGISKYDAYKDETKKADTIAEGYVVRVQREFDYEDFSSCCGKFVRGDHVQTNEHWMHTRIVPNLLCDNS